MNSNNKTNAFSVANSPQVLPDNWPAALTIAGSDSSGGAGIQADLKAFQAFNVFGATALTAITAQNTSAVYDVQSLRDTILAAQIRACIEDLPIGAIKTGMLANAALIQATADTLRECAADIPLVLDPVMVATSGARLLDIEAEQLLIEQLLPRAALVTPNLPEAAVMTGLQVDSDPLVVAEKLIELGAKAVLLKGGHGSETICTDWLVSSAGQLSFDWPRRAGQFHGTGCAFSAAITALLAKGESLQAAVSAAGLWLQQQIGSARKPLRGDLWVLPFSAARESKTK
ncbi:MAG: bifunctional hydroxymethylpyrimidine kinase/phosphomethylpyrimidine kinase [Pseudomonadota bacterium]